MPTTRYFRTIHTPAMPHLGMVARPWRSGTILSGGQQEFIVNIGSLVDVTEPDTYSIQVVFTPTAEDDLTGKCVSNTLTFTVNDAHLFLQPVMPPGS